MRAATPNNKELHIAIASTFTIEPVERSLVFWLNTVQTPHNIQFAPYDQVFQQLLDPGSFFSQNVHTDDKSAVNLLYVKLDDWKLNGNKQNGHCSNDPNESVNGANKKADSFLNLDQVKENADEFIQALTTAASKGNAQYLVVFCPPTDRAENGKTWTELEAYILNQLKSVNYVSTVDTSEIEAIYPLSEFKNQHTARAGDVPYTDPYFSVLGTVAIRKYLALTRPPAKVIVLDCDNTLWEGVCGEEGPLGVKITPEHAALQSFVLQQQEQGMLICLNSKNVEPDVWAVFEQNDNMVLKQDDVVAARINWSPKSENLKSLAESLNLGLDSFIFIDDNPLECAEVRAHAPEVITLQLPDSPANFATFLNHIWPFDKQGVTEEDKHRAARYQENVKREEARNTAGTLRDFLQSLNLAINISSPDASQVARLAQLTQRTNQFNTTTIRRSEAEIKNLILTGKRNAILVDVKDRFGDYGIVGAALFHEMPNALFVDSLMLSCRALGRGVEFALAKHLAELAQSASKDQVDIAFAHTERNKPVHAFLESVAIYQKQSEVNISPDLTGVVYSYSTNDLSDLDPLHAATPSLAQNGKAIAANKTTQVKPEATSDTSPSLLWQNIATQLSEPAQIYSKILLQKEPRPAMQVPFLEPQTQTEKQVADIWKNVLGLQEVGLEDGFRELGGTSLQLVQIYGQLMLTFEVDLPFTKLFGLPNIRSIVEHIQKAPDQQSKAQLIKERALRQKAALQKAALKKEQLKQKQREKLALKN